MGQYRTLTRLLKVVRDKIDTSQGIKPGTFERNVITLTKPLSAVEHTFNATKGHRQRRVALEAT